MQFRVVFGAGIYVQTGCAVKAYRPCGEVEYSDYVIYLCEFEASAMQHFGPLDALRICRVHRFSLTTSRRFK